MHWGCALPGQAVAALLCAVAGFADAIGYLHLSVFAANMTGNTVLLAIGLAQQQWALSADRLLTLACFFGGAMFGRVLLTLSRQHPSLPLLGEAALMGLALAVNAHQAVSIWLMAAAMGAQASAMTRFNGAAVSTVVVTSTMTRLAQSAADLLVVPFGLKAGAPSEPVGLLLGTWLSYALGAAAAAWLLPWMAQPLAVACAALLALSVWLWLKGR
jgi:uncharacterized membrane protein YoaK (UPF0700 family)